MLRKSRKNVGLIGLGIIGSRVAAGLRAAGFSVFVWNRSPKAAPNFVGSPAEVAGLCEIIQIFVADAQALFDVIEQMSEALTSRHLVICCATVGPEATIEAARLVEARGAVFLDAPFTGSKGAAEKRELVYYLGGDEVSCLRARPILEATSRAIVRIGEIGHAATIKVVTNMIAAVSTQTLAEALAIVRKAGLHPDVLTAALEHNAARSGTLELKLPKMISGDYEPHFSLKHMHKDLQLGIGVANALDLEIPATTATAGVMSGALQRGWSDLDYAALFKVYEPQLQSAAAALPAASPQLVEPPREDAPLPRLASPIGVEKKPDAPRVSRVVTAPVEVEPPEPAKPEAVESRAEKRAPSPLSVVHESAKVGEVIGDPPQAALFVAAEASPKSANGESPKVIDLPAAPIGKTKPADSTVAGESAPPIAEAKSAATEPAGEETPGRPLNFVRRWFVSRGQ